MLSVYYCNTDVFRYIPGPAGRNPRCAYCPIRKNRFTPFQCDRCQNPICKEHTGMTKYTCNECLIQQADDE